MLFILSFVLDFPREWKLLVDLKTPGLYKFEGIPEWGTMSTAGVAAQDIRVPLKTGFLHNGQALGNMKSCWGSHSEFEK